MVISFAGHSRIPFDAKVKIAVKEHLRHAIEESGQVVCYLGGYGDFDSVCASACREIKQDHGAVELVYVSPYMTPSEQAKIKLGIDMGLYDTSVYPPLENVPPKFAIIKRNEWMMTNADIVIAYVRHAFGGAYRSLTVAKAKKKRVVNIYDQLFQK